LIAGLLPQAHGVIDAEMRAALNDREELIEARADAVLEAALTESTPWTNALGAAPTDRRRAATWRKAARVVAAYRDRYRITDDAPLGAPPESAAQKIDAARARSAFDKVRQLVADERRQAEVDLQAVRRDQPGPGRSI
nr:conjugal transfer protein [Dermatophilaceae bacterium]